MDVTSSDAAESKKEEEREDAKEPAHPARTCSYGLQGNEAVAGAAPRGSGGGASGWALPF